MFHPPHHLNANGIGSIEQAEWGLLRFYIDALLYWGDLRNAYRALRAKSHDEIKKIFEGKCFSPDAMKRRGLILPMHKIPTDDRYLIGEFAYKAYSVKSKNDQPLIEQLLLKSYRDLGQSRVKIGDLFGTASKITIDDQYMLSLATEEFMEDEISNEEELKKKVTDIATRFVSVRDLAIQNTRLYLSFVNELDVCVATSMRKRDDYRNMARDCEHIFGSPELRELKLRYFDPTISAARGHEDKGLIECLMVKSAKAVLYFAGDSDSYGKDAEIAMAMSLGKPVIILCPDTPKGKERERIFRDIHPLSRLIEFGSGVAIGAIVTRNREIATEILSKIFTNNMQYKFEQNGDGYFRLREKITGSVVRLQTNWKLLREAFWNYYHSSP